MSNYNIPTLHLDYDLETKAVLKQLNGSLVNLFLNQSYE